MLTDIIPKDFELEDVINLIFEECYKINIPPLLDTIILTNPSFTLSPYNEIRRAIIEDREHLLTNTSLTCMLVDRVLDLNDEKVLACHNLAYRINHPYIYPLPQIPIFTHDYNLNFLWINLNPQDRIKNIAEHIFKDGLDPSENSECIKDPHAPRSLEDWTNIKSSFTYRLSRWAESAPGAQINMWYDSALVTQKAQQKTFEMMQAISASRGVNLKLRDIRQLPNIGGEIEYSLHPGTPVFYRVDLLKALIADHMISSPEERAKYCVVSDIDVEPMTPEHLFDQRTLEYLTKTGYVFNRVGLSDFENSFFIFNKEKENLQHVHRKTIIKATASAITELRNYPIDTSFRRDYVLGSQSIFNRYPLFLEKMKEFRFEKDLPRKVVKCPRSQFNCGGRFSSSDHQTESFRFIGADNIPYTMSGRNNQSYSESQIQKLMGWKAEPLDLIESIPPPPPTVAVEVLFDAGWGNSLEIRGTAPNMSWDKGIPMSWTEGNKWKAKVPFFSNFEYKILLKTHDHVRWAIGENRQSSILHSAINLEFQKV